MNIGFIGLGKLGLPVAATLAHNGHTVHGYDVNPEVKTYLRIAKVPYREKRLVELLAEHRIKMMPTVEQVVLNSDIVFVAIQTPHEPRFEGTTKLYDDRADFNYDYLVEGLNEIFVTCRKHSKKTTVVVISTCLPGTYHKYIQPMINEYVNYVYNPFFIAMGQVRDDFENPEFVLIGNDTSNTEQLKELYGTIHSKPFLETDITTAEAIKVSYNTYITMKTVLANTWGEIAQKVGANVDDIHKAWSMADDRLMSPKYLQSGMGDGGGCHPRDNIALSYLARELKLSHDIFTDLIKAREDQTQWFVDMIKEAKQRTGHNVMILGKTFKPGTNICTGSPAVLLSNMLEDALVRHRCYDPKIDSERKEDDKPKVYFIATAHEEFKNYPYARNSLVIDPFGIIDDRSNCVVVRLGRK